MGLALNIWITGGLPGAAASVETVTLGTVGLAAPAVVRQTNTRHKDNPIMVKMLRTHPEFDDFISQPPK
jgi:hypothetical protein